MEWGQEIQEIWNGGSGMRCRKCGIGIKCEIGMGIME